MRARKRLAALLVAGALSAPMLTPAPASAQLSLIELVELDDLLGGGLLTGVLGDGLLNDLTGVLGDGLLNDLTLTDLLTDCALVLGILDPATCLTAVTQTPTTTTQSPTGFGSFGGIPTGFGSFGGIPTGFGGFGTNQPIVITNNNSSNSTSAASATVAPGGGASATASGNSSSTQNQTIVIP